MNVKNTNYKRDWIKYSYFNSSRILLDGIYQMISRWKLSEEGNLFKLLFAFSTLLSQ